MRFGMVGMGASSFQLSGCIGTLHWVYDFLYGTF